MLHVLCRNKLRSRPALMSPPTNAFSSTAVAPPSGMPAELGFLNRQGNQENLAAPYSVPSQVGLSALQPDKQQTLARRRVVPQQQGRQIRPGSDARSDGSSSSSSSATGSGASSSSSAVPVRRAQGMAATAPRATALKAAPKPRATRDSQVRCPCFAPSSSLCSSQTWLIQALLCDHNCASCLLALHNHYTCLYRIANVACASWNLLVFPDLHLVTEPLRVLTLCSTHRLVTEVRKQLTSRPVIMPYNCDRLFAKRRRQLCKLCSCSGPARPGVHTRKCKTLLDPFLEDQQRVPNCCFFLSLFLPLTCIPMQVDLQFADPGGAMGMAVSPGDLTQCEGCGRSFNPKAFEIHSRICAKVFQVG